MATLTENEKLYRIYVYGASKLASMLKTHEVELIENTVDKNEPNNNIIRVQAEDGLVYSIVQRATKFEDQYLVYWILQNVKRYGIKINLVNMRRHNWKDMCTNPKVTEKEKYHWFKTNDKLFNHTTSCMKVVFDDNDKMSFPLEYGDSFYDLFADVYHCTKCASYKKQITNDTYIVNTRKIEQITTKISNIIMLEEPIEQLKELLPAKYFKFSMPRCVDFAIYDELQYAKVTIEYTIKLSNDKFVKDDNKFASVIVITTVDLNTFEIKYNAEDTVKCKFYSTCIFCNVNNDSCISLDINVSKQMKKIVTTSTLTWTYYPVRLQDLNNADCKLKQIVNVYTTAFQRAFAILEKLK